MGISILDNFDYRAGKPNFTRDLFATVEEMVAFPEMYLPSVFECNVVDTGERYRYNVNNDVDPITGKWRLVTGGTGGSVDGYTKGEVNTLLNKKLDKPETDGTEGQVLTVQADGTNAYADVPTYDDTDIKELINKKIDKPEVEGTTGQVLTVQADGTNAYADVPQYDDAEIKEALNKKLDKPEIEGTVGQVLTVQEDGTNAYADVPTYDDTELRELITNISTNGGECLITEDITVFGIDDGFGYKNGDVIALGTTVTKALKGLLQKVIHPTYKAPTLNLGVTPTLIEYNVSNTITLSPTFTKNNGGSVTSYTIYKDGAELHTGGSTLEGYTDTITPNSTNTITYKYTVNYGDGEILKNNTGEDDETGRIMASSVSKEGSVKVVYPTYVGVIDNGSVDSASILANCEKLVRTNTTLERKFTASFKTIVFVTSGNLTSIINQNGYEVISNFAKGTVNINGVDLNCYSLANVNVSNFNYKFIF